MIDWTVPITTRHILLRLQITELSTDSNFEIALGAWLYALGCFDRSHDSRGRGSPIPFRFNAQGCRAALKSFFKNDL